MSEGDMELIDAQCANCNNTVGSEWREQKAPIVIKPSGWIVCKNCNSRWLP